MDGPDSLPVEGDRAKIQRILQNLLLNQEVDDNHPQGMVADHVASAPTVPAQSETLPTSQRPGEGVGLSIVKRLCELLDASLELETSPGEGSTFRVILPSRYDNGVK